jgi:DNA-binding LacI/PurR family transcriptional regulator
MSKTQPTMKDIADECGVSLSTVSLVLNNNPRISDETRRKVLATVERFGYLPDSHARGLALRSSRSISVVVPNLNHVFADIYFGEIVSGIYEQASEEGYKLLLDVANPKFVESKEYLNVMKSRRADAMLFIASSIHDEYLREFEGSPHAFILVNHYFPSSKLNFIAVDYRHSARLAAEHLRELGHRHVGLIAGTNTHTGLAFRDAFLDQFKRNGSEATPVPWVDGGKDWSEEGGYQAARDLLGRDPRITAIMAGNDRMALGAMRFLHEKGLRIPGDVSVMGVDDMPQASFMTPRLSTIHHPIYRVGQLACQQVIRLFRNEITTCRESVEPKLVARESTGPAHPR